MVYLNKQNRGFTLLEIIIVVGITGVLSIGAAYTGTYMVVSSDVYNQTHTIETAIETAKDDTLNHYNGNSNYGIYFTNNSFSVYAGTTYSSANKIVFSGTMTPDISIQNISFNGNSYIYFQSVTGAPSNTGSITLHSFIRSYQVAVNANGAINITKM